MFTDFCVYRASELTNVSKNISNIVPTSTPDHSCLTWKMNTDNCLSSFEIEETLEKSENKIKFNVRNIPVSFGADLSFVNEIHARVSQLERSLCEQQDLDNAFTDMCKIIENEMLKELEYKTVLNSNSISNKHRLSAKPWWNDDLGILWNDACAAEKHWIRCKSPREKKQL